MASGPFAESYDAVRRVEDIVSARLRDATNTAASLRADAASTIRDLSGVNLDVGNPGDIPLPPVLNLDFDFDFDLPEISPTSFGEISAGNVDRPALDALPGMSKPVIPDFSSGVGPLNIPDSPQLRDLGDAPEAPVLADLVIPTAPDMQMPSPPILEELNIPTFDHLVVPAFDIEDPEFAGTAIPAILAWAEPEYRPEVIDEVVAQIRKLWEGGSGIPAAVEDAMFQRAAEREGREIRKEIDSVDLEFSKRGFDMPSGIQAARTDALRKDLTILKLGLQRETTIQIAQWQVENVRFAVEQGIAAENVLVNIFENTANRMFEAYKFQIDGSLRIYDAQVSLYNAHIAKMQASTAVFEGKLKAELARIDVFKAEIDGEIARGQINDSRVRTYEAMIRTVTSTVEVFKARMQGASIESDIVKNRVDAYRASVAAFAERVKADKTRFEAYESQVRGESAKAGIIDAEAKAYSALIQGKIASADIDAKFLDSVVKGNSAKIEEFRGLIDLEKTAISSQLATIEASSKAYVADTQRFVALAQASGEKAKLGVSAKEAEIRTNVAYYQAQVQAYIGKMELMIKKAQLALDGVKAAGQISSTLAAGAMAGVSVGASLGGSGSVGATGSYGETISKSTGETRGYSEAHNFNYDSRK